MSGTRSPWLSIPPGDYEAHMREVGQSEALRGVFARACRDLRPRRVLVLGCSTGADLPLVDPLVTRRVVGVDLNPAALDEARRRGVERCCDEVRLVAGDVLDVVLPEGGFDLVHAALVFEYVDAQRLFRRIAAWLDPRGRCVAVTQAPVAGIPPVSRAGYDSLNVLDGRMTLRTADEMRDLARRARLVRTAVEEVPLPFGKRFSVATFAPVPDAAAPEPS